MSDNIPAPYLNKLTKLFAEEMQEIRSSGGDSIVRQRAYQKMLKKARLKYSKDALLICVLNYGCAGAFYDGADSKKAVAYYLESLNYAIAGADGTMEVKCRCALSAALLSMGERLRSYEEASLALKEATALNAGGEVACYALGLWESEAGNHRKAVTHLKKALKICEAKSDTNYDFFIKKERVIHALGWAYYNTGNAEAASDCTYMIEDYGNLPQAEVPRLLFLDMCIDIKKGDKESLSYDADAFLSWFAGVENPYCDKYCDLKMVLEAFIRNSDAERVEKLMTFGEQCLKGTQAIEDKINILRLQAAYFSHKGQHHKANEILENLVDMLSECNDKKISSLRQAYEGLSTRGYNFDSAASEGENEREL